MKIGLVMVNYNDYENVQKMLSIVGNYKIIDKIVVVDNASTDDSLSQLKRLTNEKIIILENDHNGGYGAGLNIGAKYLNEQYSKCIILMSNTDIVMDCEDDIQTLVNTFDENISVVAPIIKEHTGYNCGWKVPTPWQDILLSLPGIYKKYQKKLVYPIEKIKNNITEVEAVSGSFFLIRGKDLEAVNYFDENIFLYYEENILSKKLQQINKKIVINGNAEVFHNHSITIDKVHTSVQKYKNLKKSQYYFQTEYNHAGIVNKITMKLLFQIVEWGLYIHKHKNLK